MESQRRRGSINIRKRRGERVSPCMVPLPIVMGSVRSWVERLRTMRVLLCEYSSRMESIASGGKPRSCIMRNKCVWLIVLKALVRSM